MQLLYKQKLVPKLQAMQMQFILTQAHILKLKKLVLRISLELQLIMNLSRH
ncbi:Putative uncharacterized protein [Lactococcus lactis subsp. lactis A12]|uniref:Uncharacterized protein n=1 Tax=Lactococcus lactis subsp. lactis A12 TaxID=1137134 RepID=S6F098_LACLL|nr:Putative uncharacterized protein [Lactococcus lactis subsp. lactis A12]